MATLKMPELARGMELPALARLAAPVSTTDFAQRYWSREHLLARHNPGAWDDLFTLASAEHALTMACRIPGAVEEFHGHDRPLRHRAAAAACAALRRGGSLRINGLQRFNAEVGLFARQLERDLSFPVNANAYLTPPDAQALGRHFDTHDVFVLQIHGRKRWRLFGDTVDRPLEYLPLLRGENQDQMKRFRLDRQKLTGTPPDAATEDFTLEPGDLLYLPRGFWHEAVTSADAPSCHITIGVQAYTYLDLLVAAISNEALATPLLRESLPLGFVTHANREQMIREHLAASPWMECLGTDLPIAIAALAEVLRRARPAVSADIAGGFRRAGIGAEGDRSGDLRVRPGVLACVAPSAKQPGYVSLGFGQDELELPADFEPSLRRVATGGLFKASELPGAISDEERVSLVDLLREKGLLCRA